MYREASSRIRSIKGHVRNRIVSKFASTSAKSSSGGLFSWFTGGSSWRLPPVDFPHKGIELPSSLPDDVETKTTTLPNHSLDQEIARQQLFPSFLASLLGGGGSFSRLFSEVVGTKNQCELVLDGGFKMPNSGGFDAPDINAFGHTFRNYDFESKRQRQVEELYKMNHVNQTYDFVSAHTHIYRGGFKCEPFFHCERENNRERATCQSDFHGLALFSLHKSCGSASFNLYSYCIKLLCKLNKA
ncbi:hypothetical protein OSB04_018013 [Centaurea solstitialis]|uniref:inositol oxygenase n=1 Tax=Centaurea solstitialis TaxID=347529 RepID=A0AA38TBJ9_9ASTR|nr:hypothetical protein OSB04_018013 [Centaurea solstitialis]